MTDVITDQVTVVVATRNRRDRLAGTLPRHAAPVVLVDNGSDDGGPDFVESAFPQVDVVRLPDNRGAAARNVGVERATTRYVAFADDDSYWAPGALDRAVALMDAHPKAGLLAARVLVGTDGRLDPVSAQMAAAPLGVPAGGFGPSVLGFLACSVLVRRDAFRSVGGFRPQLHVYGEEALLAMDLAAAGHLLCYAPDVVVHHLPGPAGRDTRARDRREARNRLLTAVLRRPPAVIARTVTAAWRTDPRALGDAARLLPWALRERRSLPRAVESDLVRLSRPATPAPPGPVASR